MKRTPRAGKVAHGLGLSTWFGGTLFGQVSLNPTVSTISDQKERGRVLNGAWARFQAANLPAMLSALLGWRLGGVRDDSELRAPALTRTKDILLGGAAFNSIASALLGARTAARSRGGATPVRSGSERGECPEAVPVLVCHDEVVVECDEERAAEGKEWLVRAMKDGMDAVVNAMEPHIRIDVETSVSKTWGG